MKSIVFVVKNNYCVKSFVHAFNHFEILISSFCSGGSAKSNRIGISTIPGSPQEIHDQQKCESIFPLSTNPSSDMIEKVMDEQENLVNSDDDDEQAQMPVDDGQTECNRMNEKIDLTMNFFLHF